MDTMTLIIFILMVACIAVLGWWVASLQTELDRFKKSTTGLDMLSTRKRFDAFDARLLGETQARKGIGNVAEDVATRLARLENLFIVPPDEGDCDCEDEPRVSTTAGSDGGTRDDAPYLLDDQERTDSSGETVDVSRVLDDHSSSNGTSAPVARCHYCKIQWYGPDDDEARLIARAHAALTGHTIDFSDHGVGESVNPWEDMEEVK